jgi:hypothetical protein
MKAMRKDNAKRMATCHPDKPHHAKGLCRRCYHIQSRPRLSAISMAWAGKNPQRWRQINERARLKYRYGIDEETKAARLREQGGVCAICQQAPAIHIDHDHSTRTFRGLLCKLCNIGLGCFKDDAGRLSRAIAYLSR